MQAEALKKHKMKIIIKNGEDFAFSLLLVGIVLIWIASSVYFKKSDDISEEHQDWLNEQPLEIRSGVDY